ncbi:MAG: DUF86 domain-containing protein [Bifidobacteriaceae bacterium]|nr:DUF86 domain-containing protein [Bifidobacteriaceae bacterium]
MRAWLGHASDIVRRGKSAYMADPLIQEAGDSLMMKLGEAANRLERSGLPAPDGASWSLAVANRNWLIHQYDEIDRDITWNTLAKSLPEWGAALARLFAEAGSTLHAGGQTPQRPNS